MHIETYRTYCLSLPGTSEGTPFGPQTLVFKVMGKMFALCGIEDFRSANLKCDPEQAVEYREQYMAVQPGYHMNKTHWNTVMVNEDVSDELLLQMTKDSYDLVAKTLTKALKQELKKIADS
ncbi:MAG: MmcQ/YjbR family DNA-binding protein [Flavobacteriales bacterium]